jgi:hypothetical protein
VTGPTPQRQSWWTTLPGILTGIAAVITAVVALIGALQVIGVFDEPAGTAPAGQGGSITTPGGNGRTTAPPAGTGPTGGAAASPGPLPSWVGALSHGLLTMNSGDIAVLETGTVGFAASGQDFVTVGNGRRMSIGMLYGSTSWFSPIDAAPDKEACRSALNGQKRTNLDADDNQIGHWWCVRTSEGYTGAIQLREVAMDEAPKHIVLAYVLWR